MMMMTTQELPADANVLKRFGRWLASAVQRLPPPKQWPRLIIWTLFQGFRLVIRALLQGLRRLFTVSNFLFAFTAILIFVATVFLALWIVVNLFWPAEEAQRIPKQLLTLDNGGSLFVDYPAVVLANDTPVTFTFTLRNDRPITETLIITAGVTGAAPISLPLRLKPAEPEISASITETRIGATGISVTVPTKLSFGLELFSLATPAAFSQSFPITLSIASGPIDLGSAAVVVTHPQVISATHYPSPTLFVVAFAPDGDIIQPIQIINAKTESSSWWPGDVRPLRCIYLSYPAPSVGLSEICTEVETIQGSALRAFVNAAVNERGPLIIAAAGVAAGAGALWAQGLRLRQKEQAERARDRDKQRVQQTLTEFREAIRRRDLDSARIKLRELDRPERR